MKISDNYGFVFFSGEIQKKPFVDVLQNRCLLKKGNCVGNFIKKRLQHRCFHVNIAEFLRTVFFYRTPVMAASGDENEALA